MGLVSFVYVLLFILVNASDPNANPRSVLVLGNARFTMLTSQLIRLEYVSNAQFQNNATFAVINRYLESPAWTWTHNNDTHLLQIKTEDLLLEYNTSIDSSMGFTENNLVISFVDGSLTWNMSLPPTGNLLGTIRTLDDVNGSTPLYCPDMNASTIETNHCTLGLISVDGWVLLNDSYDAQFDNSGWPWFQAYPNVSDSDFVRQDLYFFGHGHDYWSAMYDWKLISGEIHLFPRYVYGPQFSRWHAYNQEDEINLLRSGFEYHEIPLDLLVLDMDWHWTWMLGTNACTTPVNGWTGYTWNTHLFPNPSGFISWLKENGIHLTNNMHPDAGVQCIEKEYPPFASAMGVDPASNVSIPYEIGNKTYCEHFMEIVLKPLSGVTDGIDYWWVDYQQGEEPIFPGVNPTWWVNYVFTTSYAWFHPPIRPMLMARWGGYGNQRFPQIGFSGDVTTSWESLEFQPYFTATAANVGFPWSHDIGGFYGQPSSELFLRWLQWGAISNLLRTHTDGKLPDGLFYRSIWLYPYPYYPYMRQTFVIRSKLVPYIYTMAFRSYQTGVAFLRSMYYDFPNEQGAYQVPTQYMYGDTVFASPVLTPSNEYNITEKVIWIPPGEWFEIMSGTRFHGPQNITRNFSLSDIPMYAQPASIIQMQTDEAPLFGSAEKVPESLHLLVTPGRPSKTTSFQYDDDGVSTRYEQGEYYTTPYHVETTNSTIDVYIGGIEGHGFEGMPEERWYLVQFVCVYPPKSVMINGEQTKFSDDLRKKFKDSVHFHSIPEQSLPRKNREELSASAPQQGWFYDGMSLSLFVHVPSRSVKESNRVEITFNDSIDDERLYNGYMRKLHNLQQSKDYLDNEWGTYYPAMYPSLLDGAEYGRNWLTPSVSLAPDVPFPTLLSRFYKLYDQAISEVLALSPTPTKDLVLAILQMD